MQQCWYIMNKCNISPEINKAEHWNSDILWVFVLPACQTSTLSLADLTTGNILWPCMGQKHHNKLKQAFSRDLFSAVGSCVSLYKGGFDSKAEQTGAGSRSSRPGGEEERHQACAVTPCPLHENSQTGRIAEWSTQSCPIKACIQKKKC